MKYSPWLTGEADILQGKLLQVFRYVVKLQHCLSRHFLYLPALSRFFVISRSRMNTPRVMMMNSTETGLAYFSPKAPNRSKIMTGVIIG